MPSDLSEQFLYALQKKVDVEGIQILKRFGIEEKIAEGTYLLAYLNWFRIYGAPHERVLPYEGGKLVVSGPGLSDDLKQLIGLTHVTPESVERVAAAWGKYGIAKATGVNGPAATSVEMIQKWLDDGALAVPAAYRVHGPTWSTRGQGKVARDAEEPLFTPEDMEEFKDEVLGWLPYRKAKISATIGKTNLVSEVLTGKIERRDLDRSADAAKHYGGHSMTIVGYTNKAFIVKNSWGPDWGNQGYCFVSFDYHRLYCWHCARIESVKTRIPALSPFEKTKRIRESDYRLRLQPIMAKGSTSWQISLFAMDARDPMLEVVSYGFEARSQAGEWRPAGVWNVTKRGKLADFDYDPGFALRLDQAELRTLGKDATALRCRVRLGHFPLGDLTKLEEADFLATKTFGEFVPLPERALEFEAR